MHRPKLQASRVVHSGYCSVIVDQMETPEGSLYPYTRIEFGFDACAILAQTPGGLLVINRELRYPTGEALYSCSGGKIDEGETPEEGARRELLEETGYTAQRILFLGALYPFPALSAQRIHYYLAVDAVKEREPVHEPLEQIESHLLSETQLQEIIHSGKPVDGILCTALYLKSIHKNI